MTLYQLATCTCHQVLRQRSFGNSGFFPKDHVISTNWVVFNADLTKVLKWFLKASSKFRKLIRGIKVKAIFSTKTSHFFCPESMLFIQAGVSPGFGSWGGGTTVARKFSIRGLCSTAGELFVCAGGLDIIKLTKPPLIYSVSRFSLGGLGALFGGDKPTKASSWRRDWAGAKIYGRVTFSKSKTSSLNTTRTRGCLRKLL